MTMFGTPEDSHQHALQTLNMLQEYDEFMAQYRKDHACCPKCGAKEHSTTLMAFVMRSDNREAYKDENNCVCSNCGDRHIAHDRVPEKTE